MNPKLVLAERASAPLYDRFVAVTAEPLVATVASQTWLML